jgi:transcriptional regulator with XRE-family HTH domain
MHDEGPVALTSARSRAIDRHIGRRLQDTRIAVGWPAMEFAERIGLSDHALAAIEAGRVRIEPLMLMRAAELMKVSVNHFFEGAPEAEPSSEAIEAAQAFARFLATPEALRIVSAFNAIDCERKRSDLIQTAEALARSADTDDVH